MDTIFAQGTAKGKAGVSIIRVSGEKSLSIAKNFTNHIDFEPNRMYLSELRSNGVKIDSAMVVYFKAPCSFTGEDVVEFHLHGSIAVVRKMSEVLLSLGIRIAEPGEFSKRAFLNGKMDLTAAEGLADLIDAETEIQHRQAIMHMGGEFEVLCGKWREMLLKSQSLVEAYIDFPDEEIPESVLKTTNDLINDLKQSLNEKLDDKRRGERLRSGISMVVLGEPNVGKSSLMNFLVQREISIISDIAGTTRDVIESHLDIAGYPIILADTAGIRDKTEDVIEKEGITRALKVAQNADIKLIILDVSRSNSVPQNIESIIDDNSIIIHNKIDLIENYRPLDNILAISIKSKIGLELLLKQIAIKAEKIAGNGSSLCITRQRHRDHIQRACDALDRVDLSGDLVLAAEDLRLAVRNLSLLTGKIEVEEILGEIFQNFCIGK